MTFVNQETIHVQLRITENPLKIARERLQLSRRDLARALDVDYERVVKVELGYVRQLPRKWAAPLGELGIEDFDQLASAYVAWRIDQARGAPPRPRED